jgi:hypothetical protein
LEKIKIFKAFVEKMLETTERSALERGRREEREELVSRLLASDMSSEDVLLELKIRVADIETIGRDNQSKIADYVKKLKARRKSRNK